MPHHRAKHRARQRNDRSNRKVYRAGEDNSCKRKPSQRGRSDIAGQTIEHFRKRAPLFEQEKNGQKKQEVARE